MLRRVVDLTLTMKPMNDYQRDYPPMWSDFENTGPERKRVEMQKMVKAEPFLLDGNPDELMMNITIGHSTGHTHVDVFLHDWKTMFEDIPRDQRWAVRDVSQVPSHELIGPVAVVDVSEVAPFGEITLPFFKEKAKHVQNGDMVFIKSGHSKCVKEGISTGDFTVVPPEVADWLGKEKNVRVCGFDHKINGNFITWSKSEGAFYRNGILMIDRMNNLDMLESGARYFASVGVSFKMAGVDDSPARVFVIDKLSQLDAAKDKTIDLFYPIDCYVRKNDDGLIRSEPYSCKERIMNRLRLENIHITQTEYEGSFGGPGFMGFKSFCNFLGTHIVVPVTGQGNGVVADSRYDLSKVSTDRLWGKAVLVDAWEAGPGQDVTAAMLDKYSRYVDEDSAIMIRTSYSDYYFGQDGYLQNSPGLSDDAIAWLVNKKVKMVILDFASAESSRNNCKIGKKEHLAELAGNGILVVENAYSMWRVTQPESIVFVSPMAFPEINASPCRVLVYEEYR